MDTAGHRVKFTILRSALKITDTSWVICFLLFHSLSIMRIESNQMCKCHLLPHLRDLYTNTFLRSSIYARGDSLRVKPRKLSFLFKIREKTNKKQPIEGIVWHTVEILLHLIRVSSITSLIKGLVYIVFFFYVPCQVGSVFHYLFTKWQMYNVGLCKLHW